MLIREFQEKYRLANREVAVLCGCSLPTIQKWRSGSVAIPVVVQRFLTMVDAVYGGNVALMRDFVEQVSREAEPSTILAGFSDQAVRVVCDREIPRAAESMSSGFESVFDLLPDMAVLLHDDGTVYRVNRRFAKELGCSAREAVGRDFSDFCEENATAAAQRAAECVSRGGNTVVYLSLRAADGMLVDTEASFSFVRHGTEEWLAGVFRDLRVAGGLGQAAVTRLRYDRLLTRLSEDAGQVHDPAECLNRILSETGAAAGSERAFFCRLSDDGTQFSGMTEWRADGVAPARLNGLPVSSLPVLMESLRRNPVLPASSLTDTGEAHLLQATGLSSALFCLVQDNGRVIGLTGLTAADNARLWSADDCRMIRGVADLIWSVLSRNESSSGVFRYEYEDALHQSQIGFWCWEVAGGRMSCNAAWAAMLGMVQDEVIPRIEFWKNRIHPDDFEKTTRQLDGCLRRGVPFEAEFRIRHQDGSWRWMRSCGTVSARDEHGLPLRLAGTQTDITRYKETELRLTGARAQAEKAGRLRGDYLAGMGHQLRTPMDCILGAGQILHQELQGTEQEKMTDIILQSSGEMMRLIDRLANCPGLSEAGGASDKADAEDEPDCPVVLVAEDNPASQAVLGTMLGRLGCRVVLAGNGLEAVQAVKQQRFDLIFMDIEMPVMNGVEAVREIRRFEAAHPARPPAVICAATGYAMPGDREKYLAAGMNEYLAKPIRLEALDRVIQQHWGRSGKTD